MSNEDLYQTLGVSRQASTDDIRKAYRKLAKRYHPDVNPNNKSAEEKFKAISAAYDILSDPKRKQRYDSYGHAGLREGFQPEEAAAGGWSGARAGSSGGFDVNDLFQEFFGRNAGEQRNPTPTTLEANVQLTFQQALYGSEITLEIPNQAPCSICQGAGQRGVPQTCYQCQGTGVLQMQRGMFGQRMTCPQCQGTGQQTPTCGACRGSGQQSGTQPLTVRIPAGADEGSTLKVPLGGKQQQSIVIRIHVQAHPHFRREKLHLHLQLPVTIGEAYLGSSIAIPTPSGEVLLRIPPLSQAGTTLRLKGKGVKRGADVGDMLIHLEIRLPNKDNEQVRTACQTLETGYTHPIRPSIVL